MYRPIRKDDKTKCTASCDGNSCRNGNTKEASSGVYIEGKAAATEGDRSNHCSDCTDCFPPLTPIRGGANNTYARGRRIATEQSQVFFGKLTASTNITFIN